MPKTKLSKKKALLLLILLFFVSIFLTVLFTWPLATKVTSFYSDSGDYPLSGYLLWYNQFSFATGRILNPGEYFNSFQFYPWPYSAAYSDLFLIPSLFFTPIYWISQQLALSLNLYIFLTFALSFISSFYCLSYLIKNKYASFLGAMVYTFNPFTFAHFPDHVNLIGKYFLPPLLLFGYLFFKKPETKTALLFFLFFTLNALTSFHLMFFSNFALVVYLIFFFALNFYKRNYTYFLNILKKSIFFALFIPLLAFFYLPYLNFAYKEKATYDLQLLWIYSATLKDWVSPLRNNILYGNLLSANRTEKIPAAGYPDFSEEHTLFINTVPAILALMSLFFLFRSVSRQNQKENGRLLLSINLIVLVISVIFSFGPQLGNIKLPFYYLMQWLPIFKGTRVPSRFQFIFYIPFSILIAYGSMVIFQAKKRYFILILISLTALLIAENLNNFKFDSTSSVLREKQFIERNLGFLKGKSTLHFPRGYLGEEAKYLNFGTITGEKMINGYSGYMPSDWSNFMKTYQTSLEEQDLKKLKAIGIQYVIIHKDILSKQQAQNLSSNQIIIQKGTIFDQKGIQIISLDKFDFDFKLCSFDKDFDFKLERLSSFNVNFYKLNIENKSDCYLTSTFQNRYRSKVVYDEGIAKTARIRMPIIIAPFEKISVDEIKRDLKIEQKLQLKKVQI